MNLGRHDGAHTLVAFVGKQRDRPGLGNQKVPSRNAHIRSEKAWTQDFTRLTRHLSNVSLAPPLMDACEQIADLVLILVHDRRNDMTRWFIVIDLQNVFAQIGLERLDARSSQCRIQGHLFGHH